MDEDSPLRIQVQPPAIDYLDSEDGHSSSEVCSPIRGQESPPHMLQKKMFWNRIRTEVLQGEDEWEAQLVADSEIVDPAHLQNPVHSDDEQTSPAPLSPLCRDIERGRRQLLESEEEDIWEEDPEVPVTPQASAPSLRQSLDAAMQSRPQRTYKYGSCEKHGALRPYIFKSGRRAGQAVLMCAQWWKFDTEGKRLCWYSRSVDAEGLKAWPRCLRNEFFSLKARLKRGGRLA